MHSCREINNNLALQVLIISAIGHARHLRVNLQLDLERELSFHARARLAIERGEKNTNSNRLLYQGAGCVYPPERRLQPEKKSWRYAHKMMIDALVRDRTATTARGNHLLHARHKACNKWLLIASSHSLSCSLASLSPLLGPSDGARATYGPFASCLCSLDTFTWE